MNQVFEAMRQGHMQQQSQQVRNITSEIEIGKTIWNVEEYKEKLKRVENKLETWNEPLKVQQVETLVETLTTVTSSVSS